MTMQQQKIYETITTHLLHGNICKTQACAADVFVGIPVRWQVLLRAFILGKPLEHLHIVPM